VTAGTFAAVFAALLAGHQIGDYWVQTNGQAMGKSLPGWAGRFACAGHVVSYTVALTVTLCVAWWWLRLPLSLAGVYVGLAVSAVTHYFADRRKPLERVARLIPGKIGFYRAGDGLATGAALLDQAWHYCWLFVAALVISGRPG
jgi:Protein of unknown function (DUF3307)